MGWSLDVHEHRVGSSLYKARSKLQQVDDSLQPSTSAVDANGGQFALMAGAISAFLWNLKRRHKKRELVFKPYAAAIPDSAPNKKHDVLKGQPFSISSEFDGAQRDSLDADSLAAYYPAGRSSISAALNSQEEEPAMWQNPTFRSRSLKGTHVPVLVSYHESQMPQSSRSSLQQSQSRKRASTAQSDAPFPASALEAEDEEEGVMYTAANPAPTKLPRESGSSEHYWARPPDMKLVMDSMQHAMHEAQHNVSDFVHFMAENTDG